MGANEGRVSLRRTMILIGITSLCSIEMVSVRDLISLRFDTWHIDAASFDTWNDWYLDRISRHQHQWSVDMDWNRVEGNWKQVKGKVKEKWGRLTDDDLDVINGQQAQLEGKIQERYGIAKDQAKKDVDAWFKSLP